MRILNYLQENCIIFPLESSSKKDVIKKLATKAAFCVNRLSADDVYKVVMDREELGTTAIGGRIAIPHAKAEGIESLQVIVAVSKKGVPFDSVDGEPVHVIFMLLAPEEYTTNYLRVLAKISRLLKDKEMIDQLIRAESISHIFSLIEKAENRFYGVLV